MGRKKTKSFDLRDYSLRTAKTLERNQFKSEEAYSYAFSFLSNAGQVIKRFGLTGKANFSKRRIVFVLKKFLYQFQPVSHQEFIGLIKRAPNTEKILLQMKGDLAPTIKEKLAAALDVLATKQRIAENRLDSLEFNWANKINPSTLPDELVAFYRKEMTGLKNVPGSSRKLKKRVFLGIADAIASQGINALKKGRNLSEKKLQKFFKDLKSVEYNRLLSSQKNFSAKPEFLGSFLQWQELAHGHLIAEYGINSGQIYENAAANARKLFISGIKTAARGYPPFQRMWRREIPIKMILLPGHSLRKLKNAQKVLKPVATHLQAGITVSDPNLAFVFDWKHFKLRHPNNQARKAIKKL